MKMLARGSGALGAFARRSATKVRSVRGIVRTFAGFRSVPAALMGKRVSMLAREGTGIPAPVVTARSCPRVHDDQHTRGGHECRPGLCGANRGIVQVEALANQQRRRLHAAAAAGDNRGERRRRDGSGCGSHSQVNKHTHKRHESRQHGTGVSSA